MNRYINNYANIKNKIEEIKNIIDTIDIQSIQNETDKIEFLRYKKNFSILNDIIENIEPELLSGNIQAFTNNAQNSLNSLNNFKNNYAQSQYLIQANNYLDAISNFIRPYILHRKRLKNSLAKAIMEYIEAIESHLSDLDEFKTKLEKSRQYTDEIKSYYDEILGESEESLKARIDAIFEDIEEKKSNIYNLYNELFVDDDEESIKTAIYEAKEEIDKTKEETKELKQDIEDIFTNTSKTLKELKEFYNDIFGEFDEETQDRIGGLKKEIEKRLSQIDELEQAHNKLIAEQKEKYIELEKQINSLLPGATSVGLAKTYSENREKFEKQTKFWNWFFIGIMSVVFVFGLLIVIKDIQIDTKHIFKYSPIYISVIWLAIFASKRRNENMRLEQEYTHKETLAKSYMSYKEQIETLSNDAKNELLHKLLEATTMTISQNPNHFLDKNDSESHPVIEFFNNIWKKGK